MVQRRPGWNHRVPGWKRAARSFEIGFNWPKPHGAHGEAEAVDGQGRNGADSVTNLMMFNSLNRGGGLLIAGLGGLADHFRDGIVGANEIDGLGLREVWRRH